MIDASPGMLTVANENLKRYREQTKAHIVEATFPPFPFKDKTFDAIMFNQVSNSHFRISNGFSDLTLLCQCNNKQ